MRRCSPFELEGNPAVRAPRIPITQWWQAMVAPVRGRVSCRNLKTTGKIWRGMPSHGMDHRRHSPKTLVIAKQILRTGRQRRPKLRIKRDALSVFRLALTPISVDKAIWISLADKTYVRCGTTRPGCTEINGVNFRITVRVRSAFAYASLNEEINPHTASLFLLARDPQG